LLTKALRATFYGVEATPHYQTLRVTFHGSRSDPVR
jgi:hypothetical protein